ncbi:MAG: hypothetical protein CFE28_10090 [Alphaproteobacteria bacterium PA2]|nr:MAG: hypothetical protein CFE28_10090 [Alphaproteobacteria bacterium PA2]
MTAYAGLRVLDFTQGTPGPMATMFLGDFGAGVVKVEPPGGDHSASRPGYETFARNKQVLTLDLSVADDLAKAEALIAQADVVVFDHAPGKLEALGLDSATLCARHPRLIHAWMPPYGIRGKWSQLPPRQNLITALTGMSFRQGAYKDTPVHLVLPLVWYAQAMMGANAIGAALLERSRSGKGQAVVVSGVHGMSQLTGPIDVRSAGVLPRGAPRGGAPNYRLYPCRDGQWLFLGTLFMSFFKLALGVLGLGDRYETYLLDLELARKELDEAFLREDRDVWLEKLRAAGVPCGPVGRREAWFDHPVIAEAGLRIGFDHPGKGRVDMPNIPVQLLETPGRVKGLGQTVDRIDWEPRPAPGASGPRSAPLAGVRILDLGTVIAGAHAGGVLANLGADVIKIEPAEGDPFRSDGGVFLACSRGKRALGIDLKQDAARALFLDLARGADVVIDNYRLGVRDRLGIGYEALKAVNPRIISGSINAYGATGSRAERPGFDPLLQAEGGMMAAQGGDDEPILHTIAVNDTATAAVVAFGVIAALNAREQTGAGQEFRTSLMAQSLTYQICEMTRYAGRPENDLGGRDCVGVRALTRFYQCADGWIALACETERDVTALARALGQDCGPPQEALAATRDGDLAVRLEACFRGQSRNEIAEHLFDQGVPCAPAIEADEAFGDPWLWENDMFEVWTHDRLGEVQSVRAYADFSAAAGGFRYPTPDLGEHSVEVLAELGYDPDRIAALLATGAIFEPAQSKAHLRDGGAALATR